MSITNHELSPGGVPPLSKMTSLTELPQAVGSLLWVERGTQGSWAGLGHGWTHTTANGAPAVLADALQPLPSKTRNFHTGCSRQAFCHSHPLYLPPLHTVSRTHSLRTITAGSSVGSSQERETSLLSSA